jgi:hypothetical protein
VDTWADVAEASDVSAAAVAAEGLVDHHQPQLLLVHRLQEFVPHLKVAVQLCEENRIKTYSYLK